MKKLLAIAILLVTCYYLNGQTELFQVVPKSYNNRQNVISLVPEGLVELSAGNPVSIFDQSVSFSNSNPVTDDFTITTSSGIVRKSSSLPSFYKSEVGGIVVYADGGINGIINNKSLDHDTGRTYIISELENMQTGEFCNAENMTPPIANDNVKPAQYNTGAPKPCVKVYVEVDYDIFEDKGRSIDAVTDFVTGIFNEVHILYDNEGINLQLHKLFIWDTQSPYVDGSSSSMLDQFNTHRPSFDGDIGQLLSYKSSGGIAWLSGLCHRFARYRRSFCNVKRSFSQYPVYSWNVMVTAHELGHQLGSRHTHSCSWNGDNTAIDGCAGFTEGSCDNPGVPSNGGTIMSYCHLQNVGINFQLGFGDQPGNVIRNFVAGANCLTECDTDPDPEDEVVPLSVTYNPDWFGDENYFRIYNKDGSEVITSEKYSRKETSPVVTPVILNKSDGPYRFVFYDSYGDGVCCNYGDGYIKLEWLDKQEIIEFNNGTRVEYTIDFDDPGPDDPIESINFEHYTINSYGGSQDRGTFELPTPNTLAIYDNAWKSIEYNYSVTTQTVIEFEFKSTVQGEIHGIGMDDTNDRISFLKTIKVYGLQNWGNTIFDTYTSTDGWMKYVIPIGDFYQGSMKYLFFVSDNDQWPPTSNSYYRNVKIYEAPAGISDSPGEE